MRTEVKIGVAAAAFVALIGIIYFVFMKPKAAPEEPTTATTQEPVKPEDPIKTPSSSSSDAALRDSLLGVAHGPETRPAGGLTLDRRGTSHDSTSGGGLVLPSGGATLTGGTTSGVASTGGTTSGGGLTGGSLTTSTSETYVVKAGDTLARIAREKLGSESKWTLIRDANRGVDPARLQPGVKLTIPAAATSGATAAGSAVGTTTLGGSTLAGASTTGGNTLPTSSSVLPGTTTGGALSTVAPATSAGETYIVKSGDTLASIARTKYGSEGKWTLIAAANRNINPKALPLGAKLTLPAATAAASSIRPVAASVGGTAPRAGAATVSGSTARHGGSTTGSTASTDSSAPLRPIFDN